MAREVPRAEWGTVLRRGGLSESYLRLIIELYDVHNAGQIDVEAGVCELRRGQIELVDALRALVG